MLLAARLIRGNELQVRLSLPLLSSPSPVIQREQVAIVWLLGFTFTFVRGNTACCEGELHATFLPRKLSRTGAVQYIDLKVRHMVPWLFGQQAGYCALLPAAVLHHSCTWCWIGGISGYLLWREQMQLLPASQRSLPAGLLLPLGQTICYESSLKFHMS
jgi:hypothetical protein